MTDAQVETEGPQSNRAARGIVFLTVFIDLLGFGMVLPLLPIYADQFVVDEAGWQIGLLMASFSAMQFLFAPLWGRLSDRIGRRPVLMIGLLGSVVFYSLFGVATIMQSLTLLFVSRIGAGIAGATISTAQAYIADTTTLTERPKGMALIGMAFGLGFTFGPLFGYLAVPTGTGDPGPAPGFAAAGLSLAALLLAYFKLPESLSVDSPSAAKQNLSVAGLRDALSIPSIAMLLIALFVVVFAFANFETTLSMLLKGRQGQEQPFSFTFGQVCLTYAYIGFTLALVQGGIVRRVAGKVSEGILASFGCILMAAGMLLILKATQDQSVGLLLGSLAVVVAGFGFMMPSLNSFISRRSDPDKQGGILGIGQSVNSLARIIGSALGIPLLKLNIVAPFVISAIIMGLGLLLVIVASRSGKDFASNEA
ncbi:Tetracycline resistance protein, class B [Bremerella volcania]|uniref:Tetracycline resistance protein, class B n=1 Tax=Bremerella volcania TaxID=2527984 RepID=A0A518C4G4_9BACT|nr:MFS transporter [Bremerella volcania]QDU74094.1 Tetracycline resistance protein, class B [Bremerella volcania]